MTMNEVGRRIAGEWAKDNGVRKISTADLKRWRADLRRARDQDDGSGKSLKSTLSRIQAVVAKTMKSRS